MRKALFAAVILILGLYGVGCGNEGASSSGGGGGGTGAGLDGTVSVPSSTSTSTGLSLKSVGGDEEGSEGVSVSKGALGGSEESSGAEEEESEMIVSKAATDTTANSGTIKIQKLDGTLLDTCNIGSNGAFVGCDVNTSNLDSTKQIEVVGESGGKKVTAICDLTDAANGKRISCGNVNSTTTVADAQLHANVDSNATPESKTSTFKSQLADGTLKPAQVYQSLSAQLGLSGSSVGSDNAQNAQFTIAKAIRACMASLPSFGFADINKVLQGSGTCISEAGKLDTSLSGVDLTAVAPVALKAGGAFVNYFKDSATALKWSDGTSYAALAKNFAAYGASDLDAVISNPENARGLFNKYADDYAAGVANAFKKLEDGGKSFGNYLAKFGSTAMSSGQFLAAKDLFDNCNFTGGVDKGKLGEALYSQIFSADSEAEITKLRAQKGSIASLLVGNPLAYAGSGGLGAAQGLLNLLGTGGSIVGATPCASDSDCSGGKLCGSSGICFASVAGLGTGTGDIGAVCSAAGDCKSNVCTSSRCDIGSGVSFATLGTQKYFGEACTTTGECSGGLTCAGSPKTCGGTDAEPAPVTFAGTYTVNTSTNSFSTPCMSKGNSQINVDSAITITDAGGGAYKDYTTVGVYVDSISGTSCSGKMCASDNAAAGSCNFPSNCASCSVSGTGAAGTRFTFTNCPDNSACSSFIFTKN